MHRIKSLCTNKIIQISFSAKTLLSGDGSLPWLPSAVRLSKPSGKIRWIACGMREMVNAADTDAWRRYAIFG